MRIVVNVRSFCYCYYFKFFKLYMIKNKNLAVSVIMRPLTEEETKELFEKLSKYIGENVKLLIDRPDGNYCFRLAKDRIFYVREGGYIVGNRYRNFGEGLSYISGAHPSVSTDV